MFFWVSSISSVPALLLAFGEPAALVPQTPPRRRAGFRFPWPDCWLISFRRPGCSPVRDPVAVNQSVGANPGFSDSACVLRFREGGGFRAALLDHPGPAPSPRCSSACLLAAGTRRKSALPRQKATLVSVKAVVGPVPFVCLNSSSAVVISAARLLQQPARVIPDHRLVAPALPAFARPPVPAPQGLWIS